MAQTERQTDRSQTMPGPGLGRGPMGGRRGGPGAMNFAKPKDSRRTLHRLLPYLRRDIPLLCLVLAALILSSLATLAGAWMLTPVFNTIAGEPGYEGGLPKVAAYLAALGGIYLVGVLASFIQSRVMISVCQRMAKHMRQDLYDKVIRLPLRFFDGMTHGEIMSRFSNDMDVVSETLNSTLVQVLSSILSIVGTLVSMLILSIPLTLLTMVMIPVTLLLARFFMGRARRRFGEQQKALGELNGLVEETMEGQKIVKLFCREEETRRQFEEKNTAFRDKAIRAQILAGTMMPLTQSVGTFNYVIIAVVGGWMALSGRMNLGNISTFLGLSRQFSHPVTQISNQLSMVQSALAGAERVFEMMDTLPEPEDAPDAVRLRREGDGFCFVSGDGTKTPLRGDVRFEHVTFGYLPEKTVLHDVSMYAKPGQKIALVGSTGAGKTTITNLLTRFYEINEGTVTIDGIDIRRIALDDLRNCMAMVLQDTHLFSGTVMENIRYGRLDATDEQCMEAARLANAHSFIQRLPQGYQTRLEGDGANLSQGQRQLLNIARAAVADPPILILDEATSSVDTRTELHIERGMDQLMQGRTTFVIAHRLSTVRNADAIMVMEHGRIIERGSHDDLVAQKGRYYQLYVGQTELD